MAYERGSCTPLGPADSKICAVESNMRRLPESHARQQNMFIRNMLQAAMSRNPAQVLDDVAVTPKPTTPPGLQKWPLRAEVFNARHAAAGSQDAAVMTSAVLSDAGAGVFLRAPATCGAANGHERGGDRHQRRNNIEKPGISDQTGRGMTPQMRIRSERCFMFPFAGQSNNPGADKRRAFECKTRGS